MLERITQEGEYTLRVGIASCYPAREDERKPRQHFPLFRQVVDVSVSFALRRALAPKLKRGIPNQQTRIALFVRPDEINIADIPQIGHQDPQQLDRCGSMRRHRNVRP